MSGTGGNDPRQPHELLDFTAASGAGRLTQVRKAKDQVAQSYDPATDYWRPLREGIREEFEQGWSGKDSLAELRRVSADPKKLERYSECVKGLSKWARGKSFGRSSKVSEQWRSGEVSIVVNPELLLEINGTRSSISAPRSRPSRRSTRSFTC